MDKAFYRSLAALGEVGTRKASYRARVFAVVTSIALVAVSVPWMVTVTVPGLNFVKALAACVILSVIIAEERARKRMPAIISEVAQKYGVSPTELGADAMKHVDSAAA